MKTLRLVLFFLLFCGLSSSVQAQQGQGKKWNQKDIENFIDDQVEKYGKELELDDLQKALLKSNFLKYNKKTQEILDKRETQGVTGEMMRALREEQRTELATFLSEEQLTKLEELQEKERKSRRTRSRRGRRRF
ncbi:hypothetical protein GWK08_10380 [Leptobacterium flavescens]|uniref:Periplasmic heavy metal sensor n=1 Tax=Leptobacterium flavescens TaxID=472055 RepID=A0A6P0ULI4_9FLAO|nr:hypothetical protein [Leptobacterium flavescens]NER13847.1 hypothetical protein [Leptobacterium flavescens]